MIIVAVAFGLGRMYNGAHARLDEALGQRLLAVAHTAAEMTDGQALLSHSLGDTSSNYYLETLREKFAAVARLENLAEITLTNSLDQVVILSTSPSLVSGQPNDYWDLDPAAVQSAAVGKAAASRLYEVGGAEGLKQKSAHAPIMNYVTDGSYVVAVVTVSGSPDFFEALDALRLAAYVTGGLVLMVLILMGVFLSQINVALGRYRASIMRQENLAAMGRMTAGIAHEIRNPLGIIRGAGEHLQRVLHKQGLTDDVADFIPEEVDRLDQILTGYLAFGTDKDAVVEKFDLAVGVRRTLHLIDAEFTAAKIGIQLPETLPVALVMGDPRRLQQVILNLLINSRDAMPEGGTIAVAAALHGGQVRVTIADEGSGLKAADSGKVFEPFWTSKEKGSGLGLAMSRKIMEDMGGGLTLNNRSDGSGAVAEMWAPLASV